MKHCHHRLIALALVLALCLPAAALPAALAEEIRVTVAPADFGPMTPDSEPPAPRIALRVGPYVLFAFNAEEEGTVVTHYRAYAVYNQITGFFPVTLTRTEEGFLITLAEDDPVLPETDPAGGAFSPEITEAADGSARAAVYTAEGEALLLPTEKTARSISSSGVPAGSGRKPGPAQTAAPAEAPAAGIVTEKTVEVTRPIPFSTEIVLDPDMEADAPERVTREGADGEMIVTYTVTFVDGVETGRVRTAERVSVAPVSRIVVRGCRTHTSETVTEVIPYTTVYRDNADRYEDEAPVTVRRGADGRRETVYSVTYTDGKETARTAVSSRITLQPVDEIIERGTKTHTSETRVVCEEETIPFRTEYVDDAEKFTDDPERVTQKGVDGLRRITWTVTLRDGIEVDRVRTGEEVIRPARDRIIRRGTRQHTLTWREETVVNVIPFETEIDEHPEWRAGDECVVIEGRDGEETIVYRYLIRDGVETGECETVSRTVTRQPVTKVIGIGTCTESHYTYTYEVVSTNCKGPRGAELAGRATSHAMAMAKAGSVFHSGSGFVESVGSFTNAGSAFGGLVGHVPGINTAESYGYACVCAIATVKTSGVQNRMYFAAIFAYGEQEDESLIQHLGGDQDDAGTPGD